MPCDNAEKHAWIKLSTKIKSVKVVDAFTVQLVLSEAYYPALVELSMTRPYVFLSPKDFIQGKRRMALMDTTVRVLPVHGA